MKDLSDYNLNGMQFYSVFDKVDKRKNREIAVLLLNAEDIMTDAMRLLSTARAVQSANELAARMNEWCEAWNE